MPSPSKFSSWLFTEFWALKSVYRDILLAAIFVNLFALASPLFVMNVYDRVVPNQAIETLWVLAIGVGIVFVFDLLIKLIRHYFIESAGAHLDSVLSSRLFQHVLNLRVDEFPESTGAFASQIRDFDSIKQFFTASTLMALVDLPFSIMFLLVIFYVGGTVASIPLIASFIIVVYGFLVHFPLHAAIEKTQLAAAEKNAVVVESLHGIETVKAFNASARQQGIWEQNQGLLVRAGFTARRLADSISMVSGFIIQLTVVLVVVMGVYQIAEQQMSLGALIACVMLSGRALAPMVQLATLAAQYYQAKTALKALDNLSEKAVEYCESSQYLHVNDWQSEIEAKNLNFSYDQNLPVLNDINLTIQYGEKVAIIGRIGSGKSSLMRLLLGLGRPSRGQLRIGGIDISHLDPRELRAHLAYVPQEIILLRGTLRENILLKSPNASQEDLINAAKISGLYELVQMHPMGFDLPIGEQGKGLSGGQRQSVAIARAVIAQPEILVFDELTSAMDNQSEQQVIENIKQFSRDRTLILSTHRTTLLSLVDRVIVMDEGRIIADGAKEKVIDALKRGLIKTSSQVSKNV